jgi:hypothetical protein
LKEKNLRERPRLRWEQQVRKYVTQNKGRPWEETEEEELWKGRQMKRLGCTMTHLKWKPLRKKNNINI